jgi:hypothetical protein
LPGIESLSQLTQLKLKSRALAFSTYSWAELTALESLTLHGWGVQPAALAAFTQLLVLCLMYERDAQGPADPSTQDLIYAVSRLPLLTELHAGLLIRQASDVPQPEAFTALTASANLRVLRVELLSDSRLLHDSVLFRHGTVYRHLQLIDLASRLPLSEQQLELLCSCCPAIESLAFALGDKTAGPPSSAACLPLCQLAALTHLQVTGLFTTATAAAAGAAAQMTRLRRTVTGSTWSV